MKKLWTFVAVAILLVGGFVLGMILSRRGGPIAADQGPGQVAADLPADAGVDESEFAPGTVSVGPEKRRLAGIRIPDPSVNPGRRGQRLR